ncbi:hypothetical protein ACLKA6_003932 [Drosophila palustris]
MVKLRVFVFVLCFIWVLFNESHGSVQIYNQIGTDPRNISVNIDGDNGGNICIDCQNQIQVETDLEHDYDLANNGDWQRYLDPYSRFQSFLFIQQSQLPTQSTTGSTPTTTSPTTTTTTAATTTTTEKATTQAPMLIGCIEDCP